MYEFLKRDWKVVVLVTLLFGATVSIEIPAIRWWNQREDAREHERVAREAEVIGIMCHAWNTVEMESGDRHIADRVFKMLAEAMEKDEHCAVDHIMAHAEVARLEGR